MDNAWENFLEAIAALTSKALTDKETEKVIAGFQNFQQKLQRLSSHNLQRLNLDITQQTQRVNRCKHEGKTCKQNVSRGFVKTWLIAYLIKYAIGVVPALLMGKAFKNPSIFKKAGGQDTVGFAFFLSSFISTYKGVLCGMRHLRPDHEGDRLNAFVAGSVAGLTILLDKNKSRRTALTLYIFTRSIQFASSYGMKRWAQHREAKKTAARLALRDAVDLHQANSNDKKELNVRPGWDDYLAKAMNASGAAVVMSLTAMVILYAVVLEPTALPKPYYNFLMTHSGLPQKFGPMGELVFESFRHQFGVLKHQPAGYDHISIPAGVPSKEFVAANISPNIATLIPPNVHHNYQLCAMLHPLYGCESHCWDVLSGEFMRALKMYGTLNFIVTLVFNSKRLATDPTGTAKRYVRSTLRSCLFLSLYVLAAFYAPCWWRRIFNRERRFMYLLNGLLAGTAVLIEAPGRQMELALYCLPRALETTWHMLLRRGLVRNIKHGDLMLFSGSMGVLMTLYQNDQSVINKHYLAVLTRVFGRN